ncbi:MAG: polysaccharide biosynthesis protein [Roseburia sp.]|nr:polysaccharide biosynthesis protein [Roseburia sp.]
MNIQMNDKLHWIRRVFFICYDMVAVIVASFMALWVRFDFNFYSIPGAYFERIWQILPITMIITIVLFWVFRLYKSLWLYAGATESMYIVAACVVDTIANMVSVYLFYKDEAVPMPRSYYPLMGLFLLCIVFVGRYGQRAIRSIMRLQADVRNKENVMIIGAGDAGNALIKEINNSRYINMRVVCVIDDSKNKVGSFIHGVRVAGTRDDIIRLSRELNVKEIIVAIPSANAAEIKKILDICKETGCELKRVPGMYQVVNGEVSISNLKSVDVNDLLGREPIKVDLNSIMGYVSDKVILVTGGGGSIGSELCRQVAAHHPKQLIIVDIYENNAYDIQQELKCDFPDLNLVVLIASVRNTLRVDKIFESYRPDIVYHAAAHKHVPLMEDSPNEAVKNNVLGTWKVVQAADRWKVSRFVLISTDKAVNPTNVMGASKRICEMIIQTYNKRSDTEFVAVRFGNVLGSNGSVIPLFKKQIAEGGPVTVTHPDIIRYFMTIPEAVSLVLQAGAYAKGGEIFVLDMGEPVKIVDLAKNLILLSGHKPNGDIMITFTGLRPGEKLYEEMLMKEEGMQDTENKLIHIGKPIEMDEEQFMQQLGKLKDYVTSEPEDIRTWIKSIVPTYVIKA